jgi:molybdopterin molybdotransferase
MLTYDQALEKILSSITPLPARGTLLEDATGKAILTDIHAPISLPSFDNSQMDGYAVIAADTVSASSTDPVSLSVVGEVQAGLLGGSFAFRSGECVRIFTGAPLSDSADTVIPQEDVTVTSDGFILVTAPVAKGEFVRKAGEDIECGELALSAGSILRAYEISLLSGLGYPTLELGATPRVGVICTGNELVEPGSHLESGQIYNSNQAALEALIKSNNAVLAEGFIARDSEDEVIRALTAVKNASPDLIIVCGGVSVGKYDCVRPAILAIGGTIDFNQVAIRPGKPTTFGTLNGIPFFGLPGNPVSAMVTFELFVRPAILRLAGYPLERCTRPLIDAILAEPISHQPGRRTFARATVEYIDATIRVHPGNRQRSDQISGIVAADALLVIPEDAGTLPAESKVKVMLID